MRKKNQNTFTDLRDGHVYKTVLMPNGRVWMVDNLAYKCKGSYAYDDDEANVAKYGRLYTFDAAKIACPDGWHLPTREEWDKMLKACGCTKNNDYSRPWLDYKHGAHLLKSKDDWKPYADIFQATDDFGFSALPGGFYYGGDFYSVGDEGYWWTTTEDSSSDDAYYRDMSYDNEHVNEHCYLKSFGYSVRCVQDKNFSPLNNKGDNMTINNNLTERSYAMSTKFKDGIRLICEAIGDEISAGLRNYAPSAETEAEAPPEKPKTAATERPKERAAVKNKPAETVTKAPEEKAVSSEQLCEEHDAQLRESCKALATQLCVEDRDALIKINSRFGCTASKVPGDKVADMHAALSLAVEGLKP